MSVITKDLGIASAYGYAKSKGYTGTEEEFAELMASYADVAQQAEAAAQDAEDAKDAAVSAKNDAVTAKTAAQAAQSAAETASGTATTKASEAAQSAQSAAGSASAAQTSATAASGSAQTAQTAAQTATNKASEASSSASAASTAKTGAETARTGAQTAQAAAETAQENAEEAAASVSASAAQIEQNTEEIGAIKNDLSEKADKSEALSAYIVETETGSIASFTDGADDVPVKDLQVAIEPVQSGSGDPSPENIRPISGWTGANVTVNDDVFSIDFPTEAGTVYGGTLDVTTGVLTVDRAMVDLGDQNWQYDTSTEHPSFWAYGLGTLIKPVPDNNTKGNIICTMYKTITANEGFSGTETIGACLNTSPRFIIYDPNYSSVSAFKTAVTGQKLVYELNTPQTYQLTPQEVSTVLGQNNIFADTGNVTVQYRADTKLYIDKVLSA